MSDNQLLEAIRRQREHIAASQRIDRTGWTRQQWIDDARQRFGDIDGSVLDLVNGHISAMLEVIDGARVVEHDLCLGYEALRALVCEEWGDRDPLHEIVDRHAFGVSEDHVAAVQRIEEAQ